MKKHKRLIIFISTVMLVAISALAVLGVNEYLHKKEENEIRQMMSEYYDQKIALFAEENKTISEGDIDIAFIGDSLTDGYDVASYYPEYKVVNRGIGGDTTDGVLKRLDVSAYQIKPKVIVLLIGANNLKDMFNSYESILVGIKGNLPETEIVVCSLTSMGGSWAHNNQLAAFNNVKIKALAEKHGCYYVDLYTALLNLETNEIYSHYTTDGGHLTPAGYEVFTSCVKPMVDEILNDKKGA